MTETSDHFSPTLGDMWALKHCAKARAHNDIQAVDECSRPLRNNTRTQTPKWHDWVPVRRTLLLDRKATFEKEMPQGLVFFLLVKVNLPFVDMLDFSHCHDFLFWRNSCLKKLLKWWKIVMQEILILGAYINRYITEPKSNIRALLDWVKCTINQLTHKNGSGSFPQQPTPFKKQNSRMASSDLAVKPAHTPEAVAWLTAFSMHHQI